MIRKTTFVLAAAALFTASCGSDDKMNNNPFFEEWNTPFGIPPFEQISPAHFRPAIEEGIRRRQAEIDAIVADPAAPTFGNVILAYDNSGALLTRVQYVFAGLNNAETSPELQAVQEEITPLLTGHAAAVSMNRELFGKIDAVYQNRENLGLDAEQSRLLEKIHKGFVRSGAALPEADQLRLKEIDEDLSMLTLNFGKNLLADTKAFILVIDNQEDLAGLPASVIEAAADQAAAREMAGKWVFTLDKPSWIPFLQYAENRDLRERLYKGWLALGDNANDNNNRQIVSGIVKNRVERARLLGYDSHADYVLEQVMAANPANVYDLLDQVWTPALNRAKAELAEMKAIKTAEGEGDGFESWDWWFYAEKVRKEKYDLDENELRPYFSLETVREGIFDLSNRLYGITFRPLADAPKYHPDNQVYETLDKDGSHLGILYMDFHPRAGKRGGAWCTSYRPQSYENGTRVAPISTIVCNFTPATADAPALLSMDEVETFFHEFGHALHGLLSDVKYNGLRGTERDFVELPSQIMERWAVEPEFLRTYARHYRMGETIPDELIGKIVATEHFNQGFATTELVAASYIDMDIHTLSEYRPFDLIDYQNTRLAERGLISEIEPRYRYPYFNHIFNGGYASGYYSYAWSEVLDADAFEAFAETGDLFDPATAARFRTLLQSGGSKDGMTLYREFRGKDPDREPFLRSRGLL